MNENEQQQIEVGLTIDQARNHIERMKSYRNLTKNKDFIKIIAEGYFKEEAFKMVKIKALASMEGADQQSGILRQIDSIGYLQEYFRLIEKFGEMAEGALPEHIETQEELLQEAV